VSVSALLSIYHGTRAGELRRSLDSIAAQSRPPDEVVLVLDGPVSPDVRSCCDEMAGRLPIRLLEFPRNRGLGLALRDGLEACRNGLVARMDTDDVSRPTRFEEQEAYLAVNPGVSLVGGILREFYGNGSETVAVDRAMPTSEQAVRRIARFRNPVNHPTIMFRRDDVLQVGSYQHFPLLEDYHLVVRLLASGRTVVNLDRVFVETSPDDAFFRRRGGLEYLRQELRLTAFFRSLGFHTFADSLIFTALRAPYRLVPGGLRESMYRIFLRRRGNVVADSS